MMVRSRVLLPTPLRPRTARLPCAGSANDTPSSTTASPYPARTSMSSRSVSAMVRPPEIHLAHLEALGDLARRALHEDPAGDHDDDAAREAEHDVHVVLDEEDRKLI